MENPKRPYGKENLFTFGHRREGDLNISELLPELGPPDGYELFDLAIIEVDDEGRFADRRQLNHLNERVRQVREHGEPIVVGFIHGWHNNADWDNANLQSFTRLLKALMLRELEALQRRVMGYMWDGTVSP